MLDRVFIDSDKTFTSAMVRAVEPKMQRSDKDNPNSPMEQAKDKDGVLKWTVVLSTERQSAGGKSKYEDIPVTITSLTKPALESGRMVSIEGLEMGIMVQTRGGFSVFFSAQAIKPVHASRVAANQ
ncbi:MAG TPA: hypothetical protein VJ761_02230 [Ktedonobacteraceae bacterium]|nr:hypothetical protein [Ktedonobacteraceae bacterium]